MNQSAFLSIVRHLLTAAGGWAMGRGYIDAQGLDAVIGGVLVLAAAAWSAYERRKVAP